MEQKLSQLSHQSIKTPISKLFNPTAWKHVEKQLEEKFKDNPDVSIVKELNSNKRSFFYAVYFKGVLVMFASYYGTHDSRMVHVTDSQEFRDTF